MSACSGPDRRGGEDPQPRWYDALPQSIGPREGTRFPVGRTAHLIEVDLVSKDEVVRIYGLHIAAWYTLRG
jgi:hypothetical protein